MNVLGFFIENSKGKKEMGCFDSAFIIICPFERPIFSLVNCTNHLAKPCEWGDLCNIIPYKLYIAVHTCLNNKIVSN